MQWKQAPTFLLGKQCVCENLKNCKVKAHFFGWNWLRHWPTHSLCQLYLAWARLFSLWGTLRRQPAVISTFMGCAYFCKGERLMLLKTVGKELTLGKSGSEWEHFWLMYSWCTKSMYASENVCDNHSGQRTEWSDTIKRCAAGSSGAEILRYVSRLTHIWVHTHIT